MTIRFRVRAPQWDEDVSPEEGEARDRHYREEFLPAKRDGMDWTLWEYFFYDGFHDGTISDMRFDTVASTLTFDLSCPNVKFHRGDNFRFVNVDYHVVMHQVEQLTMQRRHEQPAVDATGATFGYAEIDTCEEEMAEAARRTGENHFHSMIIEADLFNLLIVFRWITVGAKEPAATELMRADPRYSFPFAER